jgi:glutathione S-transferase
LALEYKGVPYVSRRLDAGKQEHRAPAFLALNPRGKVPVLKTDDTALYESVPIIAFLDRAHPAVPLLGQTAQEHGRVWQRVNEFENYTRDLFDVEIVRPLLRGYAKDDPEAMRVSAARVYDALAWRRSARPISSCSMGLSGSPAAHATRMSSSTFPTTLRLPPRDRASSPAARRRSSERCGMAASCWSR